MIFIYLPFHTSCQSVRLEICRKKQGDKMFRAGFIPAILALLGASHASAQTCFAYDTNFNVREIQYDENKQCIKNASRFFFR